MKVVQTFSLILLLLGCVVGQDDADWMRIESNDKAFSVEFPITHKYFFDSDGFSVARNSNDFQLTNVNLLTSLLNGSLLSVEIFDGKKGALDRFYEQDRNQDRWEKSADVKIGETKIRELRWKDDSIYAASRYFHINGKLYILTAASRKGRTSEITRFLESMRLGHEVPTAGSIPIGDLKSEKVVIEDESGVGRSTAKAASPTGPKTKSVETAKLLIIRSVPPGFVQAARENSTVGTIIVRATFAEDGFIPKIVIKKSLPNGLVRQSLFALMRMRYLPVEKDGKPASTVRPVTFSFSIY